MAENSEKSKKPKRPTAEKRLLQDKKKNKLNKSFKSKILTAVKKVEAANKSGDSTSVQPLLNSVYSLIDKAEKKGIYKRNQAARKKSRLTSKLAKAS